MGRQSPCHVEPGLENDEAPGASRLPALTDANSKGGRSPGLTFPSCTRISAGWRQACGIAEQPAEQSCSPVATATAWSGPRPFGAITFWTIAFISHEVQTTLVPICTAWRGPRPFGALGVSTVMGTTVMFVQSLTIAAWEEAAVGGMAGLALSACQY